MAPERREDIDELLDDLEAGKSRLGRVVQDLILKVNSFKKASKAESHQNHVFDRFSMLESSRRRLDKQLFRQTG